MRDIVLFLDVPNSGSRVRYYEAARSLGLLPVRVTGKATNTGDFDGSDVLQVSATDIDAVLAAVDEIGRERIAGVFACGSAFTERAAWIAEKLGLPHADPDAISLCNDKRRLRDFLTSKGVNTVNYRHVTTLAEAHEAAEWLGGAIVVKPISSTGSDGVRICRTRDEALLHARRLLKRKSDGLLMEQYIDAPQYSVECFDGIPLIVKRNYFLEG
jgi:biotin carboxylase